MADYNETERELKMTSEHQAVENKAEVAGTQQPCQFEGCNSPATLGLHIKDRDWSQTPIYYACSGEHMEHFIELTNRYDDDRKEIRTLG